MRVLFHRLADHSTITLPHIHCDYMIDCLFHGLRSLLGPDCVDSDKMVHMYKGFQPVDRLYGKGFTLYAKLPDIEIDRTEIERKLTTGFFDLVVVGIHTSVFNHHRGEIHQLVKDISGNTPMVVIDGNDEEDVCPYVHLGCPVYKRELPAQKLLHFRPIDFGIPKEVVVDEVPTKTQLFSQIIPKFGGFPAWTFNNEESYYEEYRRSKFAWTWKKGGWACMRHIEITACGCVPMFRDIENCPATILTAYPKKLCHEVIQRNTELIHDEELYHQYAQAFLDHTKQYLTTEAIARYVLETSLN